MQRRSMTAGPAVAMTAVSMVLTLAVVVMWLGEAMPWGVALVVGLGLDGGWLATLAYERRLARQGDHNRTVTAVGWSFGVVATAVLVVHALLEDAPGAWLAVSWLPLAAKALWLVHGLWEATALTPHALERITAIRQGARDDAAVARAQLRAEAGTEETRLRAVTEVGARVARVQAQTAERLAKAWQGLETAHRGEGTAEALTCVTGRVTPVARPAWELPVWAPSEARALLESASAGAVTGAAAEPAGQAVMSDAELDAIVADLRDSEVPPLSYRELSRRFRAAGHSAGEPRLRAAWHRVTAQTEGA